MGFKIISERSTLLIYFYIRFYFIFCCSTPSTYEHLSPNPFNWTLTFWFFHLINWDNMNMTWSPVCFKCLLEQCLYPLSKPESTGAIANIFLALKKQTMWQPCQGYATVHQVSTGELFFRSLTLFSSLTQLLLSFLASTTKSNTLNASVKRLEVCTVHSSCVWFITQRLLRY